MQTRRHNFENLNSKKFAALLDPAATIVLYDRNLISKVAGFRRFLKTYPHVFALDAGEKLKSLESFAKTAERVHSRVGEAVTRKWTVLAIGGGSVGDFAGFFASVYRRGLRLVHVPTTWLAAIDSSHGGKTALNLAGAKNQIGTFYPATDTVIVRSLLRALPKQSSDDAMGEILKIALIDGRAWTKFRPFTTSRSRHLWRLLPSAIDSKLRIVKRDPFERKGYRQILNLGHTFGHVLESRLRLSHGRSVALGLLFAVDFSEATGALTVGAAAEIRDWLERNGVQRNSRLDVVDLKSTARLLRSDKKRDKGDFVWFVVIRGRGKVERRLVTVAQILSVARHYGWLR